MFITEIAKRTGFGTTTIFRWATEAGAVVPFSERLAAGSTNRQFGRECIGKKGVFHTAKGGVWIPTDSTYEFARLEQLEALASVSKLGRCRDRIPYFFGGRDRSYIPDFKIEFEDGTVVVEEVKPTRWAVDPKVRAKVAAAQDFYSAKGVIFRVITEEDIGLANIKAAADSDATRSAPDAIAAAKLRTSTRRAATQKSYITRKRQNATPEEMTAMRAQAAAYQRKYRSQR